MRVLTAGTARAYIHDLMPARPLSGWPVTPDTPFILLILRDLIMSPISVFVFMVDVIRKPTLEDSLYLRLMLLGRKSDRTINLFDEYKDAGHFTVDQAVEELEQLVLSGRKNQNS